VRALVVTHVHIDHVGRIPYLLAAGYRGPIICSQASAALLPLVLEDALKVGFTRDQTLIERFLAQIRSQLVALPYKQWHTVIDRRHRTARQALPGRPHPRLGLRRMRTDAGPRPATHRLLRRPRRALHAPAAGARHRPMAPTSSSSRAPTATAATKAARTAGSACRRSANTPSATRAACSSPPSASAAPRNCSTNSKRSSTATASVPAAPGITWDDLDIIVDSPLAADFTAGYAQLRDHWDAEARRKLASGRHPLAFDQLTTIDDHATHLRTVDYLARTARPAIVIAASGMCSGGRIVNYLKAMLGDPRHDVLFIGYQASGTPGRDIQKYGPKGGYVELDGQRYPIRAGVHTPRRLFGPRRPEGSAQLHRPHAPSSRARSAWCMATPTPSRPSRQRSGNNIRG
jgi:metallo-beta-lactamase family protein